MWKIELPTTRPTGSNPASVTSRNSLTLRSEVYRPWRFCSRRSTPDSGNPLERRRVVLGHLLPIRIAVLTVDCDAAGAGRTAVPAACMVITQPRRSASLRPETNTGPRAARGASRGMLVGLQRRRRRAASRAVPSGRARPRQRPCRAHPTPGCAVPSATRSRASAERLAQLRQLPVLRRRPGSPRPGGPRRRREHHGGASPPGRPARARCWWSRQ